MDSMGTLPLKILHQAASNWRGFRPGLGVAETIRMCDANLGAADALFPDDWRTLRGLRGAKQQKK
jgi:hypothetical protein